LGERISQFFKGVINFPRRRPIFQVGQLENVLTNLRSSHLWLCLPIHLQYSEQGNNSITIFFKSLVLSGIFVSFPLCSPQITQGYGPPGAHTEATARSATDDRNVGCRGLPLSVYCCNPLQSHLAHVNQPRALVASDIAWLSLYSIRNVYRVNVKK
jgi:hypothetical protein